MSASEPALTWATPSEENPTVVGVVMSGTWMVWLAGSPAVAASVQMAVAGVRVLPSAGSDPKPDDDTKASTRQKAAAPARLSNLGSRRRPADRRWMGLNTV